jgi:hypothetical protein
MLEREFWEALRRHINCSAELSILGHCDWLEPRRYFFGGPDPHIEGIAGFLGSSPCGEYEFSLLLPDEWRTLGDLEWGRLIPASASALSVSLEDRRITVSTLAPRA